MIFRSTLPGILGFFAVAGLAGGLLSSLQVRAETVQDLKSFLGEQLGTWPKKTKETFTLNDVQRKALVAVAENAGDSSFIFYFGKTAEGALKISCTVVPQQGKEGPMSIGICFEPDGVVHAVKVLEYSEDRGKPVKEMRFLKQFTGKKAASSFRVGKDVDAISGATRSSEAVSEAVRKSAFAFTTFVGKGGGKP